VCLERRLAEPIRTTDVLRDYCENGSLGIEEVGVLLRRVRALASFVPARSDPNRKWWITNVGE
jgi:hypothetical protein